MTNVDVVRTRRIARDWRTSPYYDRAEKSDWVASFWADNTIFRRMFSQLDLSVAVELASGRGRHTARILAENRCGPSSRLFLIDVNKENVRHCIRRFGTEPRVKVYRNNGINYSPIRRGTATAIFCYDAMVHFEYDCVISYLRDTMRILKPGGKALFHHSNYAAPGSDWARNPHLRNFMTKDLFAHIALRSGLEVLEQEVIDWGEGVDKVEGIDCLSLVKKPARPPRPWWRIYPC